MLAPLSWLKDYVDTTLAPYELGERLTEVGLGTEKIIKTDDDTIFEFEITPNRPDLLSILGIAREIAAVEGKKIKLPKLPNFPNPKKTLRFEIKTDKTINPRFTGIIIDGINVKDSPKWLQERLIKINQRPINNIVDITNYVMFELGNPIHAFDYERIIDLCGIKGGFNSGTFEDTKTIFIRVPVEDPILIRKASQALNLRSEASSIFERGVNAGGTIDTLKRCVDLVLETAGGEIASNLYDLKISDFSPWNVNLNIERLNKILGIEIPKNKVIDILDSLNLSPVITKGFIECTIPTYRNDLKTEEDLIEEVARIYGYNNFPKTIPTGEIPIILVPYFKDYKIEEKAKNILIAAGFSEIYTYSLMSESDLENAHIKPERVLRVDNPVSREFEYLRPTLKINLLKAFSQNKPNFKEINLFELGKVYLGKNLDETQEVYFLSGISNVKNFYEVKGIIERLFLYLGIKEDPTKYIEGIDDGVFFEINFSEILKKVNLEKIFIPLPKYPPVLEDLAIVASDDVKTGDLINEIKNQSSLIHIVSLLDQYEETRTFHIVYQHRERNLTTDDVSKIREKILKTLGEKFKARLKQPSTA